jgi:hypothetical protein
VIAARTTQAQDAPALGRLFAERFGRPLSLAEWQWKYHQLPGEGRSVVACDAAGEPLAHAGAIGLPARWQRGEGLLWQLVDFVGRPGRLRPPVLAAAQRLLASLPGPGHVPWNYGFPSQRHFELGRRLFGYRYARNVQPWAGDLPAAAGNGGAAEVVEHCGGWAEEVWEACDVLGIRRSASFLNWRYHDRPERYYRYYRLRSGGEQALLVAAFVEREAWLAELWLPAGVDWLPALLEVARDLRGAGLTRWRAWPLAPGGGAELFAELGLAPDGEAFLLGLRPGDEVVADGCGLYYAMGDYDVT